MSTPAYWFGIIIAPPKKPEDRGIEQRTSTIGEEIVEVNSPPGNEALMILVKKSVHRRENERPHQRVCSQYREWSLIEKSPSCEPAENKIDDGVNDLVRARRQFEAEMKV